MCEFFVLIPPVSSSLFFLHALAIVSVSALESGLKKHLITHPNLSDTNNELEVHEKKL